MRLPYFTRDFLARIRAGVAANVDKYGPDVSWVEEFGSGGSYHRESNQVVGPPPVLVITTEKNPANDAENAKRIYRWLNGLTPILAMDERLWAYLTHCMFAQYMSVRWPVDTPGAVHRRYLLEGPSFAALSRNGISRLWWAAHLTVDEARENPFELTEVLFLRQDIQVSLLERSLGKCKTVRAGVLEFLGANRGWLADDSFGRRIQVLIRELNLLGGVAILDALPSVAIHAHLDRIGRNLVNQGNPMNASTAAIPVGNAG